MGTLSNKYRYRLSENMYYDPDSGLIKDGHQIELTVQQDDLLRELIEAEGKIVPKSQLAHSLHLDYAVDNALIKAKERLQNRIGKGIVKHSEKGDGYYLINSPIIEKKNPKNCFFFSNIHFDKNQKVFGRKGQIKKIGEMFESYGSYDSNREKSRIVVISGISGIGKSTLAREYAKQVQSIDQDYIIIEEIAASAQEALLKLVPVEPDLRGTVTAIDLLNIFRKSSEGKRILLIINDFNIDKDLDKGVENTVHWENFGCDIILTTWYDKWIHEYRGFRLTSADLRPKDTEKIFLEYYCVESEFKKDIICSIEEMKAIDQISDRLQNVPLLIRLTATQMSISVPAVSPSQEIKIMDSWGLNFKENSPFASSYFGLNYKKDTENIGQMSYYNIIDFIWKSGQNVYPFNDKQMMKVLSLMTLTSNYGISEKRFGEWSGLNQGLYQAGSSALRALSLCGWVEYISSKRDPLDKYPLGKSVAKSGVYIMPEPIRNALIFKKELNLNEEDFQPLYDYNYNFYINNIYEDDDELFYNEDLYFPFMESWLRLLIIYKSPITQTYLKSLGCFIEIIKYGFSISKESANESDFMNWIYFDEDFDENFDENAEFLCGMNFFFNNYEILGDLIFSIIKDIEHENSDNPRNLLIYDIAKDFYEDRFYEVCLLTREEYYYLRKNIYLKSFGKSNLNVIMGMMDQFEVEPKRIEEIPVMLERIISYIDSTLTLNEYLSVDPLFSGKQEKKPFLLHYPLSNMDKCILLFDDRRINKDEYERHMVLFNESLHLVDDFLFSNLRIYDRLEPYNVLVALCWQCKLCCGNPICFDEMKRILRLSLEFCDMHINDDRISEIQSIHTQLGQLIKRVGENYQEGVLHNTFESFNWILNNPIKQRSTIPQSYDSLM